MCKTDYSWLYSVPFSFKYLLHPSEICRCKDKKRYVENSEDSGIASVALDNKDSKEDTALSSEETTEPDDSTEGGEEVESEGQTDRKLDF